MNSTRSVVHSIDAVPASDGAGVQLKRIMSQPPHQLMDPFLLLDELQADHRDALGGGFPPHPHRGIETISCMLVGGFRHEDHMGNRREVGNGGMQWMKSGRGVIHSEMPVPEQDRLHGFQLWLNMPRKAKMDDPQYMDIDRDAIPEWPLSEGKCRVLVGALQNDDIRVQAPTVREDTQALVLDVKVDAGGRVILPVTPGKVMIYVYRGVVNVAGSDSVISIGESTLAVLSESGDLELTASEQSGLLVLAGEPLNEPVVQSGPFVMNTREEIERAFQDYRTGELVATG
ncbi:pirin family protein [Endozoicomonas euniceicola]|uniref:Pirin family protein n=1 Tax=Endozoicomonas euniceicola TaxID=1234143 RepID=A0ABY6GYD5_9GAMM|nr:pirin family protein [Endozoicomonas euniceicola]UYM17051.1 pirin family protein [Endozoicomonas euniceicola]